MEGENFGNSTDTTSYDTVPNVSIYYTIALCIISLLILVPNIAVFLVIVRSSELKTKHRIEFILWLCLSDIMVGIAVWLCILLKTVLNLAKSPQFCNLIIHFVSAGMIQSLLQSFLICLERYLAIRNNRLFQKLNRTWKYSLIFGFYLFAHAYVGTLIICFMNEDQITVCSVNTFPNFRRFYLFISVLGMPVLVGIACLYASATLELRHRGRKINTHPNIGGQIHTTCSNTGQGIAMRNAQNTHKREKEYLLTVGMIISALFIMTGPMFFAGVLEGTFLITVSTNVARALIVMTILNSILNPILYACRIQLFRKELRKLFCH